MPHTHPANQPSPFPFSFRFHHQVYSHPWFLSALFTEQLPFVEVNGEQIIGTTNVIIERLGEIFGTAGPSNAVLDFTADEIRKEEMTTRNMIDKTLYR